MQLPQLAQPRRDLAVQSVVAEIERAQVGECAQLCRDLSRQFVLRQVQMSQPR